MRSASPWPQPKEPDLAKKPRAPDEETDQDRDALDPRASEDQDLPPTQDEIDQDKAPLPRDQAEQLLRAGHRLRIKGDDPKLWVTMTRHAGDLCIAYPALPEALDDLLGRGDLILADA